MQLKKNSRLNSGLDSPELFVGINCVSPREYLLRAAPPENSFPFPLHEHLQEQAPNTQPNQACIQVLISAKAYDMMLATKLD